MKKLTSYEELNKLRNNLKDSIDGKRPRLILCGDTGCKVCGSSEVETALKESLNKSNLLDKIEFKVTGCLGFCEKAPLLLIFPGAILYQKVQPNDAAEIVAKTILQNKVIERLLYTDPENGSKITSAYDIPFYKYQNRMLLQASWHTDPLKIYDYLARGGYNALAKALGTMQPQTVIDTLKEARLRGRGGAGFSTGLKWELCRAAAAAEKYIICNADEGDPGAFMDRSLLEGNPHAILEGMLIAGFAVGAQEGILYIRAEYPTAVAKIEEAIHQARALGFLGRRILGSDFEFEIVISKGAGAFVCGEETSLIRAAEGGVGEPRQKPPYPAEQGYKGKPTVINNVETLANVALLLELGAESYRASGTAGSGGTKIFCLVGKSNNAGLIEVSFGTPLVDVIYGIGGGIKKGRRFKAVQTGGPSGGCLPASMLDLRIDFEEFAKAGSIIGSGGMIVMDEDTCIVDMARYFLDFLSHESCGKCFSCRVGIDRMLEILKNITLGLARESDLDLLEELAITVRETSLCGLGQTAPNQVLSSLKYFREEYITHIRDKKCPASVCEALFHAPCQNSCPAGVDIPVYIAQVSLGQFYAAYETITEKNPFPVVCGRVCHHPCESRCRREQIDEPLAIRLLKRFASDCASELLAQGQTRQLRAVPDGKKVAVIGAGPAGLTAAFYLSKKGYRVTVFEALPVAGGMLAVGIPDYRLPKEALNTDLEAIKQNGVEIKTGHALGRDFSLQELKEKYSAVFLAIGAHKSVALGIPGEELKGVISGLAFLKEINLGHAPGIKNKIVAVIGGGNAAVDAARSALRQGAKEVHLLYRRRKTEMPAMEEEIGDALAEGVRLACLVSPVSILGENGSVAALQCMRMKPGNFENDGRKKPIPEPGTEFILAVDIVVKAVGQLPDTDGTLEGSTIHKSGNGTVSACPRSFSTNEAGVFAGGDCVSGPATVIEAVAQGRQAAAAIDRYLGNDGLLFGDDKTADRKFHREIIETPTERHMAEKLPPRERVKSFAEVELPYETAAALKEASRCLRCDVKTQNDDENEQVSAN